MVSLFSHAVLGSLIVLTMIVHTVAIHASRVLGEIVSNCLVWAWVLRGIGQAKHLSVVIGGGGSVRLHLDIVGRRSFVSDETGGFVFDGSLVHNRHLWIMVDGLMVDRLVVDGLVVDGLVVSWYGVY